MRRTYVINKRPLLVSRGCLRCGWRRRFLMMDTKQRQIFTLAARLCDFFACRCAEALGLHRELLLEFAIPEHLHAFKKFARQTSLHQRLGSDRGAIIERIKLLDVNDRVNGPRVGVVKAALRDPTQQRHLTTFKPKANRTAGTRGLAFAAAPARLPMSRTLTNTQTLRTVLGTGPRLQIVQSHRHLSLPSLPP